MDSATPLRKRASEEYLEKKCGERNVDKSFRVLNRRKMEMAAQERAGWQQVVCSLRYTGHSQ